MIDTHCHLDATEFDHDRSEVIALSRQQGITQIVIPSVAVNHFQRVKTTAFSYPGCSPAYGIHPLYVPQSSEKDITTLGLWLEKEDCVAVGEIGLDFFVKEADRARQVLFFIEQLKMARRFERPVILHVRGAIDTILQNLRLHKVCGGIAHAFNGSRQQADEFIKLGFKLGFGGAMTYPGSTRIRALATVLPLSSMVLETDAPDMPPAWLNRGRNSPSELPRIAATLAELRHIEIEEVAVVTGEAARQALPGLSVR